tara:strand:+ start:333 stop:566 length:234 start_codon:yes stop_codon:yes gene_type:complete
MQYSGYATLDLTYAASVRLDSFFHNKINLWDMAAGKLIVEETGGVVNNIQNYKYNNIDIRTASNVINDEMLGRLKEF